MGEPTTCLVRSFSTPADTCSEGNPIRALGESISFGRFMSETLDWGKWSTFSHNRYVEEAEKYSKPGSVAAMKAYFEAHYKKKAAERAAALIPEENAQADGTFCSEAQEGNCADSSKAVTAANEQMDNETVNYQVVDCAGTNEYQCDAGQNDLDISNVEGVKDVPHSPVDTNPNVESCILVDNSDEFRHVEVHTKLVVPAEEETCEHVSAGYVKGREVNSSQKLSTKTRDGKHSHSLNERKVSAAVPSSGGINSGSNGKRSFGDSVEEKRLSTRSLRMSINPPSGTGEKRKKPATASRPKNGLSSFSTSKKHVGGLADEKSITAPPIHMSIKLPSGAAVTRKTASAAVKPRNGINFAAKSLKSVGDLVEKRSITRSLHMSINLRSGAAEKSKTASVFEQNRIRRIHSNMPEDNPVALQTSIKASRGLLNQASANPPSQGRRNERLLNKSASGGVTGNAKPSSNFIDCLKLSSPTKSNPRTATISSPFRFRSEERAVKRKEFFQRMDETKSKEEEKVQLLPRTPKGKTVHDFKKLRQSSGSISKLNEDRPSGSQSPSNQIRKISYTLPQSPKLVKKASSSTVQDKNLGNSWKPPISTTNSKRAAEKINRTTRQSTTSLSNTTRENASPNIQH
ncbi:hypothetical protein RJT34_10550 [Clitoria ternatea]|uniref:TPX2 C-terminal domain-containing protein n=1 Tax=Clitoria ternatea TaxID=43366 RepID=A0AAN9K923_CLITE